MFFIAGVFGCTRGGAPATAVNAERLTTEQRQAIDGIYASFGKVNRDRFDYSTNPVTVVDFSNTLRRKITDEHLEYLIPLTDLEELDLRFTEVSGTGFKKLAGLKRLRTLRLDHSKITDAGLANLTVLPALTELNVGWTEITDAGVEKIAALTGLEVLDISGPDEITDNGLVHLNKLTKLRDLHVGYPNIGDAGVEHLRALTRLERLDLSGQKVTDAGLDKLRDLKHLRDLRIETGETTDDGIAKLVWFPALRELTISGGLGHHRYSDAAMDHIARMTKLEALKLSYTGITNAGVAKVTKALRHLRSLSIGANKFITGAALKSVAESKHLEFLDLFIMEGVTEANLAFLRDLKKLHVLSLNVSSKPPINDAGLAHLAGLTALEKLNLFSQLVTDAGLEHLMGLVSLRELDLRSTQITVEGKQRLKAKLPQLKLVGEGN